MSSQPQGTFLPNTKVTVGSHKVYIEKYLSEGGFAHVYVVRIPRDGNKHEIAVLKRVAVPDKEHLASMRTEVETMKKLKGHKHIVTYIDSHASQLKGGGYEVFLLMEYCSGGGLIDFMNTRLQHRLTEPEILKIFGDCAEGVACMHYLKPPLLHRDLKVENVLIAKSKSGTPTYKICDFGSTAPPLPAAKTVEEGRLIEEDVQKHTTMQYRSPEMIDVWRKHSISEKADIWALGVLLYKLCYYTTPFEDVGQMAILNARFKYPNYPSFSDRLKKLIGWMLKENPDQRPNVYQVLKEICSMRGTEVPIKDIYATRSQSEVRRNESLPSNEPVSAASIGLQKTAPQVHTQAIPDVAPMRRGRPTAPSTQGPVPVSTAPVPTKGDPFAALDSKSYDVRAGAVDELSKRFPSLNEFTIAHDGGKVTFPTATSPKSNDAASSSLSERVTNVLADEAFGFPQSKAAAREPPQKASISDGATLPAKFKSSAVKDIPQYKGAQQARPAPPSAIYSSTGTGTSPPPTKPKKPEVSSRSIWRVPDSHHHRAASQPRASESAPPTAASLQPGLSPSQRPGLLDLHRSKSQTAVLDAASPSLPPRPSLDGQRPAAHELGILNIGRARSANSRSRPTSVYVDSNMDYLRDQVNSRKRPSLDIRRHSRQDSRARESWPDESAIADDMDYLRSSEESELARRRSKHGPSHHARASLHAISGAKHVAGRLGDAFKRFEPSQSSPPSRQQHGEVTEIDSGDYGSPGRADEKRNMHLAPIISADTVYSKYSDADSTLTETEDLPPEVRRELERRRLSQEEKRVAEAAAEYRARVANQGTGGPKVPTKASTIQKRVQSLLDEGRQSPVPRRTAEGYGRFTESSDAESKDQSRTTVAPLPSSTQFVARRPPTNVESSNNPYPRTRPAATEASSPNHPAAPYQVPAQTAPTQRIVSRPSAPPKPQALRKQWPPTQSSEPEPPLPPRPSGLASLLAKDLEGTAGHPSEEPKVHPAAHANTYPPASGDDVEEFSKRYPSLSGIEMVETEIDSGGTRLVRVKDV